MTAQETLRNLAQKAIKRLKELPQPVVRLSGPLTSGGFGYDDNLRRFIAGQKLLGERGYTYFDYFDGHDDEEVIRSLNLPWEEVMEYYHRPIMATGLIRGVFFLPHWSSSNGARLEHEYAKEYDMEIHDFPEEWFPIELQSDRLTMVR